MKVKPKAEETVVPIAGGIEEVSKFVYLESKITVDGNSEKDVQTRIQKASGTIATLKNTWKSTRIRTSTKLKVFKSNVHGVLLYGAES